jgi:hypothetical protein
LRARAQIYDLIAPASAEYAFDMIASGERLAGLCLALLIATAAGSPATAQARPKTDADASLAPAVKPLVIEGLGKGTIPLSGPWQFHLGDDPAWAAPGFDDAHWEQLSADQGWGAQGHYSYTGFAWYRLHIAFPPASGTPPDIALIFDYLDDAYEVYWNGALVGHIGKLPPHPSWPYDYGQPTLGLGQAQNGVLALRVWKAPLWSSDQGTGGGFEVAPELGTPAAVEARKATWDYSWLRRYQFAFGLQSLYALVCLLSLLAWLRDRSQGLLFWMAGFCFGPPMTMLLSGLRIPWSASVVIGLQQPLYGLADVSLWFLLLWLLQLRDMPRLVRLTRVVAVAGLTLISVDGVLMGMDWSSQAIPRAQVADAILTGIFTLAELLAPMLVIVAVARRRRLDPARWLVATFAFITQMLAVADSMGLEGVRYTHSTFTDKLTAPLFTIEGNAINASTLASTLMLFAIVYAVYSYSVEHRKREAALEQEFKNARELQQVLVPESLPTLPGFAVTSAYKPALEVGGDFFQIIPLDDGTTLIVLGDVSGKGLKAAMTVSLIVGVVRALANIIPTPAGLLSELNQRLCGRQQGGFTTCIAMQVDAGGRCTMASAGHPAPFLNQREVDLPGALPLGIDASAVYQQTALTLAPGDRLALYTDGLLEARSPSGELFSFTRLESLFASNPSAAQATEAAVTFGQDDDITVLTLTRLSTGEESTADHIAPALSPA